MNREIKFRAWDADSRPPRMIEGNEIQHLSLIYIERASMPLMQYTGLKDKNGVEIYEGDIVEHGEVRWHEGGFCLYVESTNQEPTKMTGDRCRRWQILGNIHQNPELLT